MAVNFDNPDERKKYIESRFSDLLDNINQVYGKELMDRLFRRLEKTIEVFDGDVRSILDSLDSRDKSFEASLPRLHKLRGQYIKYLEDKEDVTPSDEAGGGSDESDDDDIIKKIESRRKKH